MSAVPFPHYPNVKEEDVGPERTGVITLYISEFEMFCLIEDAVTGQQFAVVKKFTDPTVFSALAVGTRVRFRATHKFARIVSISIIF